MENVDGIIENNPTSCHTTENNQNQNINSGNKKRTKEDILKSRKLMMQYGKNLK